MKVEIYMDKFQCYMKVNLQRGVPVVQYRGTKMEEDGRLVTVRLSKKDGGRLNPSIALLLKDIFDSALGR